MTLETVIGLSGDSDALENLGKVEFNYLNNNDEHTAVGVFIDGKLKAVYQYGYLQVGRMIDVKIKEFSKIICTDKMLGQIVATAVGNDWGQPEIVLVDKL